MRDTEDFHSSLIRGLGGKAKLADALGLDRIRLTKWHERGIPSRYWHKVVELGAACEPPLVFTAGDLERTKPSPSPQRDPHERHTDAYRNPQPHVLSPLVGEQSGGPR